MLIELPAQAKGAECRRVVSVAVDIRRELQAVVSEVESGGPEKISILLRIGGSLGSFGNNTYQPVLENGVVVCEVEIPDSNWEARSTEEIRGILVARINEAIEQCVRIEFVSVQVAELLKQVLKQEGCLTSGSSGRAQAHAT